MSENTNGMGVMTGGVWGDPDAEWGRYTVLRHWDPVAFERSLAPTSLSRDGNRAVIYCSTTDAYQVFRHSDPKRCLELNTASRVMVRSSLEMIRDNSKLPVRILTRSPLARRDFDIYRSCGAHLLFGMSLPTLRNDLARVYEANAPAPSQPLATLHAAKAAGLNIYVAVAPTCPKCDEKDLARTLEAVAALDPLTVFMEPINIRAGNIARLARRAVRLRVPLNLAVFTTGTAWRRYAMDALLTVERLAAGVGLADRLHLWPGSRLGSLVAISDVPDAFAHRQWLDRYWNRISEWPE